MENIMFGIKVPKGCVLIYSRGLVVNRDECAIEAVVNGIEDEDSRMDYSWKNRDSHRIFIEVSRDGSGLRKFSIVRFIDRESKDMFVMKYGLKGAGVGAYNAVMDGRMN